MNLNGISITWLGHSTFRIDYDGTTIVIDPWVAGNPVCPNELKSFDKIDLMLISNGHFDHIGDAVWLAQEHNPVIVGISETCEWLSKRATQHSGGVEAMNKGGTLNLRGIDITMVHADHSCGIVEDNGSIIYGGEAVGFVLKFPNGFKIYYAGDTNVFGDMALISELYNPDLAMLPVGGRFTMGPREAAKALRLLQVPYVIPMHFGTFPMLTGRPEMIDMQEIATEMIELRPGETIR